MTDRVFSTKEVSQILGISQRQAIDWAERKLILADVQPAEGLGSRRRFSYGSVLVAKLALELRKRFKVSRQAIESFVFTFSKQQKNAIISPEIEEKFGKETWYNRYKYIKENWPTMSEIMNGYLIYEWDDNSLLFVSSEEFHAQPLSKISLRMERADGILIIGLARIKKEVDMAIQTLS